MTKRLYILKDEATGNEKGWIFDGDEDDCSEEEMLVSRGVDPDEFFAEQERLMEVWERFKKEAEEYEAQREARRKAREEKKKLDKEKMMVKKL